MTPEKKVTWIINGATILMAVILVGVVNYLKTILDLPTIILYACLMPLVIGGQIILSKWLVKSKWKDTLEEMEKKCEEEEAKSKPRPNIIGLAMFVVICLGYSISAGCGVIEDFITTQNHYDQAHFYEVIVPNCISILTLLACSILIAIITYNVYRKNIFTYTNSRLIYGIGVILIFSIIIQNHYWETTPMLPNATVAINFSLLGIFIFFFGKLFSIGVKMKEEQDLTI